MNTKKIVILMLIIIVIIIMLSIIILNSPNNKASLNINVADSNIRNNAVNSSNIRNDIVNSSNKYNIDNRSNAEKQAESLKYYNDHNKVNNLEMQAVTEEAIIQAYFEDYIYNALNFPNDAYNLLDENYRERRFENFENYSNYINNNRDIMEKIKLKKYAKYNRNNYKEYVLIDNDDKYYIFYITSPGQYKLYLDIYTADLPEFTEQYNRAGDQEKVALNINKIIAAINNQDYKYVYSKLADSFKNNYFKTEEDLKQFLQNNLYPKNEIKFNSFEREGNLYIYKVEISKVYGDGEKIPEGKNGLLRNFNIVMQLKEETDFVMSFSIEE